jgi:cell division protein FtsQ
VSVRPLRRRTRTTLWTKLRMFWIFIVTGVVVAVVAGYYVETRPEFHIRSITVSGNRVVTAHDVIAAAAIPFDANVWTMNTSAIRQRIEAIPFVKTVQVRRRFPADVELAITEREPTACIQTNSGSLTIDAQRRVLATTCLTGELPQYRLAVGGDTQAGAFLADANVARVQHDVGVFTAAGLGVRSIWFDRFGSLEAITPDGLFLRCGDDADLASKLQLVGPILDATKKRLQSVEAIDLRAPETPVVTYRGSH